MTFQINTKTRLFKALVFTVLFYKNIFYNIILQKYYLISNSFTITLLG